MSEEKLYVIKCGTKYVRFNLDGTMIACKRSGSITSVRYMSKLPFDITLAELSGIIKIEEVGNVINI